MKTKEEEEKEKRETPIRDGDSRPDQEKTNQKHPGRQTVERTKGEKKPFTKERSADVDTREDFKDAR